MKPGIVCCAVLAALMFSLSTFALNGDARVTFNKPMHVAGKQLPAGDYKVSWAGENNAVQVTLASSDKKTVVTAPAKLVEAQKASSNAVISAEDGSLKELWFRGKTTTLAF